MTTENSAPVDTEWENHRSGIGTTPSHRPFSVEVLHTTCKRYKNYHEVLLHATAFEAMLEKTKAHLLYRNHTLVHVIRDEYGHANKISQMN